MKTICIISVFIYDVTCFVLHVICFMKLIVGLGNLGEKYKNNRHNVGFMFVDYMAQLLNCSIAKTNNRTIEQLNNRDFAFDKYSQSEICKTVINKHEVILSKPQTFMNKSGIAVKSLTTHYSLPTTHLFIVHDDLDIPLGKYRIDLGRGPKLHNGLTSIEANLKSKDFWRVRIGVDNRQGLIGEAGRRIEPGEEYVLQDFKKEEKEVIDNLFPEIFKELVKKIG